MIEIIILINTLVCIFFLTSMHHFYEKKGLYLSIATLSLISYLASFKITNLLGSDINTSIIIYPIILEIIYILKKRHPLEKKTKARNYTIVAFVSAIIYIVLSCLYTPIETNLYALDIGKTFLSNYVMLIVYPITHIISLELSTKLLPKLDKMYENKFITIMINYLIVSLISVVLMINISYIGLLNPFEIFKISIITYLFGFLVTLITYPAMMYIMNKKKVIEWIQ